MSSTTDHKDIYKATFNKNNPVWKEKFKQKCLQKVQQTKSSMVNRMRVQANDINLPQIIQQEWSNFVQSSGENQPNQMNTSGSHLTNKKVELWSPEDLSSQDYYDIMQYIQQELAEEQRKQEEELIRAQYEDAYKFEQESTEYYAQQLESPFVLCPLCKHNKLIENRGIILCACGLRLDLQNEKLGLEHVNKQISDCFSNHSMSCEHEPIFALRNSFGITTLCLLCEHCGCLEVVL